MSDSQLHIVGDFDEPPMQPFASCFKDYESNDQQQQQSQSHSCFSDIVNKDSKAQKVPVRPQFPHLVTGSSTGFDVSSPSSIGNDSASNADEPDFQNLFFHELSPSSSHEMSSRQDSDSGMKPAVPAPTVPGNSAASPAGMKRQNEQQEQPTRRAPADRGALPCYDGQQANQGNLPCYQNQGANVFWPASGHPSAHGMPIFTQHQQMPVPIPTSMPMQQMPRFPRDGMHRADDPQRFAQAHAAAYMQSYQARFMNNAAASGNSSTIDSPAAGMSPFDAASFGRVDQAAAGATSNSSDGSGSPVVEGHSRPAEATGPFHGTEAGLQIGEGDGPRSDKIAREACAYVQMQFAMTHRHGQACNLCKVRKIKCDANPDGCGNCTKFGQECWDLDRLSGRSVIRGLPRRLQRQINALQMENLMLRKEITESQPSAPSAPASNQERASTGSSADNVLDFTKRTIIELSAIGRRTEQSPDSDPEVVLHLKVLKNYLQVIGHMAEGESRTPQALCHLYRDVSGLFDELKAYGEERGFTQSYHVFSTWFIRMKTKFMVDELKRKNGEQAELVQNGV